MTTPAPTDVIARNHVRVTGNPQGRPLVFAHGFGCSQEIWRHVAPRFEDDYRVVLFDHVGSGRSDISAYSRSKYDSLEGYAADIVEIFEALDLSDAVFVGHSVSAMMGVLASISDPSRFGALVLVGPSPRYVDDGGYRGGFSRVDIEGLLESLDANYLGWSSTMAPVIVGNPDRPELGEELTELFCATDPTIGRHFARVTFLSDNRADLPQVTVPTLVLQCSDDVIAPAAVGDYVRDSVPGSSLVTLAATGHLPSLSGPDELAAVIRAYLS